MKGRIERLLYDDAARLPLLGLVPDRVMDASLQELVKLGPALRNRLESVEARAKAISEEEKGEEQEDKEGEKGEDARSEILMLQAALQWIALQEDRT